MSETIANKSELLRRIDTAWAAFTAALGRIDPASMTAPGVEASWSVKDILHHLASWEAHMIRTLEAAVNGQRPEHALSVSSDADIDALNTDFFAAGTARTLEDVLVDSLVTHAAAVTAVINTPAPDLFEPDRFDWRSSGPLWHHVGGNTFWHYEEHIGSLDAWAATHPR